MNEEKIQNLIEHFIDDLTAEREPEIYSIMASESALLAEIEPMLAMIKALREVPLPIPAEREAKMLEYIFDDAPMSKQNQVITMANLFATEASLVEQARAKGFSDQEIHALRNDRTPLPLKDRRVVANEIASRLNINFSRLLEFMNTTLNRLAPPPNNATQRAFAREDEQDSPNE